MFARLARLPNGGVSWDFGYVGVTFRRAEECFPFGERRDSEVDATEGAQRLLRSLSKGYISTQGYMANPRERQQ